jgi:hypothetical protein
MLYVHDEDTQSKQMDHLIEVMTDDMKFMLHRKMDQWMTKQMDAQVKIDNWSARKQDIRIPAHEPEGAGHNLPPDSLNQPTKKRKLSG